MISQRATRRWRCPPRTACALWQLPQSNVASSPRRSRPSPPTTTTVLFPITIEVDCVQSSSVPLQGLLEAEYRMQVTYGTDGNGDSIIGRETKGFSLSAFGGSNGA